MDAIILVGGQGVRLRPLTITRHKSLVPVANKPAIEWLFDWLSHHGIKRVILAIGQNNEALSQKYPHGSYGNLEINHVVERERLESGGAIKNAVQQASLKNRFLVLNGDIFVDFDLSKAIDEHHKRKASLTLALCKVKNPSAYGVAVTDSTSQIIGFVEKPPPGTAQSNLVNAGVWIFEEKLVEEIPDGKVRVEETLFPSLVARNQPILGYQFDGLWADIGTPNHYLEINQKIAKREGGNIIAGNVQFKDVFIQGTCIGKNSLIKPNVEILDSVLWEDVHIQKDTKIRDSIIANGVMIGEGALIEGSVLASGSIVPPKKHLKPGTHLSPGERYDDVDG
jgi:mannose-1-phosphate guanylyltransferase